jgi:hypothetical protein
MVKMLRWVALLALLSLPLILFLGRPEPQPCGFEPGEVRSPCTPAVLSPRWLVTVFITALAVAFALSLIVVGLAIYERWGRPRPQST